MDSAVKEFPIEEASSFRAGVKDCVPTLIGYISIGIAAGIVGAASSLSVIEILLLSALVYAGASQFIICALLASGTPASVIVLTTFIVNVRHFLLCLTLAPQFKSYSLWKNIGIGILVTDESFGVAVNKMFKGEKLKDSWMNGLNITAYVTWILSCVTGALAGKWIADPEKFGFDFALTAMFIALLVLQLESMERSKLKLYLSLIFYSIISMVLLCLIVPSHVAILLTTIIVAAIGAVKDK
ncbi:AzlC family ABC transporter permease [Bacillus sp. AGMB 02131]|uniref:AzlC family ABC transporter permease n=1 Tax=Peribacillus faecalis TaxID=2772559 RepID=A0A927HCN6_9BACI|nr:AzlC family ABC transporter permease [Peribacillus faecalis]MBD3110229.1 AzlC family ABC transporter permease [Peribacillus faecalis]